MKKKGRPKSIAPHLFKPRTQAQQEGQPPSKYKSLDTKATKRPIHGRDTK